MNAEIGFRVGTRATPDAAAVAALSGFETAHLSDAMNRFNSMDGSVRPVIPGSRFAGVAVTVRPTLGDNLAVYMALRMVAPGDVLVIESRGLTSVAQWGDLTSAVAARAGAVGAVMDGAVRDRPGIVRVGLPVFAHPVEVPTGGTRRGPGEINVPVSVGGVAVMPGDVLVGDDGGVVVVPSAHCDQVLTRVREVAEQDSVKTHAAANDADYLTWVAGAAAAAGYLPAPATIDEEPTR